MFGWMDTGSEDHEPAHDFRGVTDGLLITGRSGFVGGTHVASNLGWRAVEALSVGDKVLTFDHGMQSIVDIQRESFNPLQQTDRAFSVHVPRDAMTNRRDMWLMPDQGMLVESDAITDALGDPFAVLPAQALEGFRGISLAVPEHRIDITTLAFRHDEVVYVEGGMLAYCPRPRCFLTENPADAPVLYRVLDIDVAQALVHDLIESDDTAAFLCDPDEIAGILAEHPRARRPALAR